MRFEFLEQQVVDFVDFFHSLDDFFHFFFFFSRFYFHAFIFMDVLTHQMRV